MFGDKMIDGQRNITIGQKNRITLPNFTNVESGESLTFVYCPNEEKVVLMAKPTIDTVLDKLFIYAQKKYGSKNTSDPNYLKLLRAFMYHIYLGEEIVDKQHRILLPTKVLKKLKVDASVYVVGRNDRLDIFQDEKAYNFSLHM